MIFDIGKVYVDLKNQNTIILDKYGRHLKEAQLTKLKSQNWYVILTSSRNLNCSKNEMFFQIEKFFQLISYINLEINFCEFSLSGDLLRMRLITSEDKIISNKIKELIKFNI